MMLRVFDSPLGLFGPVVLVLVVLLGLVVLAAVLPAVGEVGEGLGAVVREFRREVNVGGSHAAERHGASTAAQIRSCLDNGGYLKSFFNEETGRWLDLCQLPNEEGLYDGSRHGMRVCSPSSCLGFEFDEVTAFQQSKPLHKVLRYLENQGYVERVP